MFFAASPCNLVGSSRLSYRILLSAEASNPRSNVGNNRSHRCRVCCPVSPLLSSNAWRRNTRRGTPHSRMAWRRGGGKGGGGALAKGRTDCKVTAVVPVFASLGRVWGAARTESRCSEIFQHGFLLPWSAVADAAKKMSPCCGTARDAWDGRSETTAAFGKRLGRGTLSH